MKSRAICNRNNKEIKTFFDVIKVKPNHKYGYFEITQKIYHHEIINPERFIDRVVLIDKDGLKKEYVL